MTLELMDSSPPATEVLIPEARKRQRHRYARTTLILVLGGIVFACLLAAAVAAWGGMTRGKTPMGAPVAVTASQSHVYFRPVLCFAPTYNPTPSAQVSPDQLSCSPASLLTARNLNVEPGSWPVGFRSNSIQPDAALAGVPSTKPSADKPSNPVVLPSLPSACNGTAGTRCVLGPAQMTNRLVQSASVTRTRWGAWAVSYTMTTAGAALWDRVANENFHQELAIELNGVVYEAPIIQPAQSTFSSFDGKGEISASLTKAEATRLADAMQPRS